MEMNKKTVLSVLLCCALLSTATSCNRSDGIRSDNATDDQFLEELAYLNERTEDASKADDSVEGNGVKINIDK